MVVGDVVVGGLVDGVVMQVGVNGSKPHSVSIISVKGVAKNVHQIYMNNYVKLFLIFYEFDIFTCAPA